MQIYLKSAIKSYIHNSGSVRTDCDVDVCLEDNPSSSTDVIVGENGVGKSFLYQNFVYIAYLYHKSRCACVGKMDMDIPAVISRLYDSGIGWIRMNELQVPANSYHVKIRTSYHPKDESRVEQLQCAESTEYEEVNEAIKYCVEYKSRLERFFSIVISRRTKDFFDDYKIVFYSNTKYPSNIYLYSQRVLSLIAVDENQFILDSLRGTKFSRKMKLSYWLNFSGINLFPETAIKKDFLENGKFNQILKKLERNYKGYFENITKDDLLDCKLFSGILKKQEDAKKKGVDYYFVTEEIELNKTTKNDVILLYFLNENYGNVGFNLMCEIEENYFVSFKLLNSGEKYDLTLEKLRNFCEKQTLLIIDEPENSLHVCKQEEKALFNKMPCKLCLITHSPAFISGMVRRTSDKTILHLMEKNDDDMVEIESLENSAVDSLSLDSISAEYLGYSPYLQKWLDVNKSWLDDDKLIDKYFISVDEFYKRLGEKE